MTRSGSSAGGFLDARLDWAGMQVVDDGSHVQLVPEGRFHDAVAHLVQPEQLPRLTQEQAEVLAIVISDGMATRRRIEEVRGAAQWSIGPDGPVSLPRDSSETGAAALSRPSLCRPGRSCHWTAADLLASLSFGRSKRLWTSIGRAQANT